MKPKPKKRQTEAEWEAAFVAESFGDALLPDGTIDYDKLFEMTVPMEIPDIDPPSP